MQARINFNEIETEYNEIKSIGDNLMDLFGDIVREINNISPSWEGIASTAYVEKIQKLSNIFIPAERELLLSAIFLRTVGEGYQALSDSESQKILEIVNMYDSQENK